SVISDESKNYFFIEAEAGIRVFHVTGVQTCALPIWVIGGPKFYERMEVRDALAYLKVTAQPDHDLAFERVINTPKRGLGDATVKIGRASSRERTSGGDGDTST